ncbi:uncharacterized protein LOC127812458 isoform X2 [Diospyros lotus]|uniref:uncharacterized protein LOC127812458 isoform X2 n=1 Tax=Diospyros lotus TaxID=55363 RepID=UPI00224DBA4B|nr:uncharacterized protein LOC127812458 isoform X2 [Diospyros lotus]
MCGIGLVVAGVRIDLSLILLANSSPRPTQPMLVEKNANSKEDLVNIRDAAEMIWLGVDLYQKGLDIDLQKIALEAKTSRETLERLSNMARNIFAKTERNANVRFKDNRFNWPTNAIAANTMYRISQTMLLNWEESNKQTDKGLFEQSSLEIADILGACLTNLPHII